MAYKIQKTSRLIPNTNSVQWNYSQLLSHLKKSYFVLN